MTERRWLVWADDTPQVPNRQLTLNEAIVAFRDYVEDDTEEKVEIRQVDPQDLIPLDAASTPDTAADDQDADLPYYEAVRDLLIGKLHNPVSAERIAGWLADAKMLRRRELEVTSTPDTELRERYARAIARAMWGAAVNRCDPMPIDWAAADAVMAERDGEMQRLKAEVERLVDEAANALVNQATLKGMTVEEGAAVLDLGSPRELVIAWVDAARKMLGEAPNYSETRIDFPAASMEVKAAGEVERYVFTVQRAGKVTPHQARLAAEAELAAMRAQQQDMVRLPADARGEIERLLTANAGKPAGGVAHKVMLLLTDDWWEGQDAAAERQRE